MRILVVLPMLLLAGSVGAQTFHSGGVADCEGCHTMHNSSEDFVSPAGGAPKPQMTTKDLGVGTTNPFLLQGSDASSTCLICHQHAGDTGPTGIHISTAESDMPSGSPPRQLTPGGDFGWLKKDYTWSPTPDSMGSGVSKGQRHGHNIVAADFGYVADTRTTAPGGNYPGAQLSCISCHDPHGKYRLATSLGTTATFTTRGKPIRGSGSYGDAPDATTAVGAYRLLGGALYAPRSVGPDYAFTYKPPVAVSPLTFNRSEEVSDTRVAYGQGMSEWCSNCHPLMHSYLQLGGNGELVHPIGVPFATDIWANYNRYRGSGSFSGSAATAYLSLVPFQVDNSGDVTALKALTTSTAGPTANKDTVMCLSCHRAHASAFTSSLRWSMENEFITVDNAYPDPNANPDQAQGRTVAETTQAYYGRPASKFGRWQRVLCNKCHAKD